MNICQIYKPQNNNHVVVFPVQLADFNERISTPDTFDYYRKKGLKENIQECTVK